MTCYVIMRHIVVEEQVVNTWDVVHSIKPVEVYRDKHECDVRTTALNDFNFDCAEYWYEQVELVE